MVVHQRWFHVVSTPSTFGCLIQAYDSILEERVTDSIMQHCDFMLTLIQQFVGHRWSSVSVQISSYDKQILNLLDTLHLFTLLALSMLESFSI